MNWSVREGLDYVVYKARLHGIRLVLTLTNYNPHFGGMVQYLEWSNRTNITEFYTDSIIKVQTKNQRSFEALLGNVQGLRVRCITSYKQS